MSHMSSSSSDLIVVVDEKGKSNLPWMREKPKQSGPKIECVDPHLGLEAHECGSILPQLRFRIRRLSESGLSSNVPPHWGQIRGRSSRGRTRAPQEAGILVLLLFRMQIRTRLRNFYELSLSLSWQTVIATGSLSRNLFSCAGQWFCHYHHHARLLLENSWPFIMHAYSNRRVDYREYTYYVSQEKIEIYNRIQCIFWCASPENVRLVHGQQFLEHTLLPH